MGQSFKKLNFISLGCAKALVDSELLLGGLKNENFIFSSGQIPINPLTGMIVDGDFKARARQVLKNIEGILNDADSSIKHILKFTVFLTDLSRFKELNEVFLEIFPTDPPARSALEVSKLPLDADIEIECVATKINL